LMIRFVCALELFREFEMAVSVDDRSRVR
jgi:hypothetical protein